MQTIWKTNVAIEDEVIVELPRGAKALSCREYGSNLPLIDVWWLVNTDQPKTVTTLVIAGTDHPLDGKIDGKAFLGTIAHGSLRFHVFY